MPQNTSAPSLGSTGRSFLGAFFNKNESLTLGIVLLLFLALCIGIHSRYIPWNDEVQFVEPAANLYYNLGFVSREHSNQTDRTFWAANAPAYSMLLYIVFQTFHFSQTVARFLNYLIMALAVLFLWMAVRRARFLSHPHTRLLMVAFVLTGYPCYTCYSNIRYDGLCFLECSLALLAYAVIRPMIRNVYLFVLGTAMVLTNLQLPQYAVISILILIYAYSLGSTPIWRLRFMGLGFVFGGALLILLYASNPGSLTAFFVTLRQQAGQTIWNKFYDLHYYFQYDPSALTIMLFLLASLAVVRTSSNSDVRQPIIAGLLICAVLPAFFFLVRSFVFSSAWMIYVPAVVCVCQVLEAEIHPSRNWKALIVICCAASIGFGLPKALIGILNEWSPRNYSVVETFVAASVGTSDIAFCEPPAYFAAKPRVRRVYGPGYLEVMRGEEKRTITVIIVDPANEAETIRDLGGEWIAIRQLVRDAKLSTEKLLPLPSNFKCRLDVLRRAPMT